MQHSKFHPNLGLPEGPSYVSRPSLRAPSGLYATLIDPDLLLIVVLLLLWMTFGALFPFQSSASQDLSLFGPHLVHMTTHHNAAGPSLLRPLLHRRCRRPRTDLAKTLPYFSFVSTPPPYAAKPTMSNVSIAACARSGPSALTNPSSKLRHHAALYSGLRARLSNPFGDACPLHVPGHDCQQS